MNDKIKAADDGDIMVNTETIAAFFNVSRRTLANWNKEGCPKQDRGWWSLRDVIRWRESVGRSADLSEEGELKKKKLQVEIELKEVQRDFTQLKKRITDGEYLEREEVISELKRFMVTFKRTALSIPRQISAQIGMMVEPETVRRLENQLNKTIGEILEEMSVDGTFNQKRK